MFYQNKSLYQFFHRNMKQVFNDLGLNHTLALNYISSVLTHFARSENLYRIRNLPQFKLDSVLETVLELDSVQNAESEFTDNEALFVRKLVGDFTLFMTGIFREYVEGHGFMGYYMTEGRRSYHKVFDQAINLFGNDAEVFKELSHRFESYSGALDYLKKVYFYYPEIDEQIKILLKNIFTN